MASPVGPGGSESILNTLRQTRGRSQQSITRIASGNRFASAGDNPAANSISTRLRSQIAVLSQATQNAETGGNFVRVAEGGLSGISDLLARGRELSLQAANGTLGGAQRQSLNQELNAVTSEIDRITQSAQFNGQSLLNGNLAPNSANRVDIQVGSTSGPESRINLNVLESTSTQSLGIAGADISTSAGALQAASDFEQAQSRVNAARGQVGAVAGRLDSAMRGLGNTIGNLASAESSLSGTNLPQEITSLQQSVTQIQTSLRALGIQNRLSQDLVGRLLNTQG